MTCATPLMVLFVSACALATTAQAQSIEDADIVAGRARSEYELGLGTTGHTLSLTFTQPQPEGCLWSAATSFSGCPGRAGLPNLPNGAPVWAGTLQSREACGGSTTRIGDSWIGCIAYDTSPYFSVNNPGSNYWVIVANDDPSFEQCNEGPPGLSHPIASANAQPPTMFRFDAQNTSGASGKRLRFALNLGNKNFFCDKIGAYEYTIPFLSVGAQDGRGNSGPVAYISKHGSPRGTIVYEAGISSFQPLGCKAGTESICSPSSLGVHAGIYGIAHWNGVPHMLFVDFFGLGVQDYSADAPVKSNWNWPIEESFLYPGAEILSFVAGSQLTDYCGIDLPRYTTDLAQRKYRIDFGALFACAEELGLLSQPMPDTQIALDGVHWYIEGVATLGELGNQFAHAETAIFVHGFD